MKEAETSASSEIALCTPDTVVPRSWTTAEIDTFMIDVSTTRTNMAIESRMATRMSPDETRVSCSWLICRATLSSVVRAHDPHTWSLHARGCRPPRANATMSRAVSRLMSGQTVVITSLTWYVPMTCRHRAGTPARMSW